jgi:hypothetical protein
MNQKNVKNFEFFFMIRSVVALLSRPLRPHKTSDQYLLKGIKTVLYLPLWASFQDLNAGSD